MTILPASDRSLLVSFGSEISPALHREVSRLTQALLGTRGLLNLHPAYASVLVEYDPRLRSAEEVEALIHERYASAQALASAPSRAVEIAVRFGADSGPDLEDVARHTGFSAAEVVRRFTSAEYLVYFVGFSTCFPYLGGLPSELATPRLAAPRKQVPAGSVAIGGSQAGVYPLASPGGWRLIGFTELPLFRSQDEPPPLLRLGDRVRFLPL